MGQFKLSVTTLTSLMTMGLVLLFLSSCGTSRKGVEKEEAKMEDFEQFYLKFHNDPNFQLSRIPFPIKGKLVEGSDDVEWTEDNWPIMKVPIWDINDPDFRTDFERKETEFFQKVWIENTGFLSEYRFELIDGKWYLVYAYEQNM